jgi:hypothetical protein
MAHPENRGTKMTEQFKTHPNPRYAYYEFGNQGTIRNIKAHRFNLGHKGTSSNKGYHYKGMKETLKPLINKRTGMLWVRLWSVTENKYMSINMTPLIATTWLGPRPKGKILIHKDYNKQNNKLSNLEYRTQSEYLKQAYKDNIYPKNRKHAKTLTPEQYQTIKEKHASGIPQTYLADQYGVSNSCISKICSGYSAPRASYRKNYQF